MKKIDRKTSYFLSVIVVLITNVLFFSCEEDKTCDERTDSSVIVSLHHITKLDTIKLTRITFDSIRIIRQTEDMAILVGKQFKKATVYFNGLPSVYDKTTPLDTINLFANTIDSIRLESYKGNKYLFKYALIWKVFQHEDPIDSLLINGLGLPTIFNSANNNGINPSLPLDLNADSSIFTFSSAGQSDEITIKHEMTTELLSPTCGFSLNFTIKDPIKYTTNFIDSITISNYEVTPQSTNPHISIYY